MAVLEPRGRVIDTFVPEYLEEPCATMITNSYAYRTFAGESVKEGLFVEDWLASWEDDFLRMMKKK